MFGNSRKNNEKMDLELEIFGSDYYVLEPGLLFIREEILSTPCFAHLEKISEAKDNFENWISEYLSIKILGLKRISPTVIKII